MWGRGNSEKQVGDKSQQNWVTGQGRWERVGQSLGRLQTRHDGGSRRVEQVREAGMRRDVEILDGMQPASIMRKHAWGLGEPWGGQAPQG